MILTTRYDFLQLEELRSSAKFSKPKILLILSSQIGPSQQDQAGMIMVYVVVIAAAGQTGNSSTMSLHQTPYLLGIVVYEIRQLIAQDPRLIMHASIDSKE